MATPHVTGAAALYASVRPGANGPQIRSALLTGTVRTPALRGKTVTGFVMVSSRDGYDTATDDDPAVVKFTAYKYGKNGGLLP